MLRLASADGHTHPRRGAWPPTAAFPTLLESLRSEKPLYLVLYPDANRAIVQTDAEPPGEEEPQVKQK